MAKTYGTVTTFTAGSVLTAAQLNVAGGAVNNLVVPATAQLYRTSDLTYTSNATIAYNGTTGAVPLYWDTDGMTSVANTITIQTPGLYVLSFSGRVDGSSTLTQVTTQININGTATSAQYQNQSGTICYFTHHFVRYCAASDAITTLLTTTGGTLTIKGNASENVAQTRMSATWIGRTS